ncbi:MAG: alpha/beta hydrolase [Candidatus Omnitrophica bacterium]|nr:alpha/beta hydrolase [Candidatus Omnitrophota bacterium]
MKHSLFIKIISFLLITCMITTDGVYATGDLQKQALAPPLLLKPPCELFQAPDGTWNFRINDDSDTGLNQKMFGWAFTEMHSLIAQALDLGISKSSLIDLANRYIEFRRMRGEIVRLGYEINKINEKRDPSGNIISYSLPVTRFNIHTFTLSYNFVSGGMEIPKPGRTVYLDARKAPGNNVMHMERSTAATPQPVMALPALPSRTSQRKTDTANLSVDGVKYPFKYLRTGSGKKAVIFVHGIGENADTFKDVLGELGDDVTAYSFDFSDFRGGAISPKKKFTIEFVSRALESFIDTVVKPKGKIIVIGHSAGGQITSSYAARRPDTVGGLVILNSSIVRTKTIHARFFRFCKLLYADKLRPRSLYKYLILPIAYAFWLTKDRKKNLPFAISQIFGADIKPITQIGYDCVNWEIDRSITNNLSRVSVLLLGGKDDPLFDNNSQNATESVLIKARSPYKRVTVSGGHFSHIEDTHAVLEALKQFIFTTPLKKERGLPVLEPDGMGIFISHYNSVRSCPEYDKADLFTSMELANSILAAISSEYFIPPYARIYFHLRTSLQKNPLLNDLHATIEQLIPKIKPFRNSAEAFIAIQAEGIRTPELGERDFPSCLIRIIFGIPPEKTYYQIEWDLFSRQKDILFDNTDEELEWRDIYRVMRYGITGQSLVNPEIPFDLMKPQWDILKGSIPFELSPGYLYHGRSEGLDNALLSGALGTPEDSRVEFTRVGHLWANPYFIGNESNDPAIFVLRTEKFNELLGQGKAKAEIHAQDSPNSAQHPHIYLDARGPFSLDEFSEIWVSQDTFDRYTRIITSDTLTGNERLMKPAIERLIANGTLKAIPGLRHTLYNSGDDGLLAGKMAIGKFMEERSLFLNIPLLRKVRDTRRGDATSADPDYKTVQGFMDNYKATQGLTDKRISFIALGENWILNTVKDHPQMDDINTLIVSLRHFCKIQKIEFFEGKDEEVLSQVVAFKEANKSSHGVVLTGSESVRSFDAALSEISDIDKKTVTLAGVDVKANALGSSCFIRLMEMFEVLMEISASSYMQPEQLLDLIAANHPDLPFIGMDPDTGKPDITRITFLPKAEPVDFDDYEVLLKARYLIQSAA